MLDRVFGNTKAAADAFCAKGVDDLMDGRIAHMDVMTKIWSHVKTNDLGYRQKTCHANIAPMANSDKPFKDIADRLRWHRALEGMDQKEYAKEVGVTRSSLNNWESGDYRLSIDGALKLRRTFGLSLDFMYEGIDDALPMTLRKAWRDKP